MNRALFQQRAFTIGVLIALAFFAGNTGFLFIFTFFLQLDLGLSPLYAGLTFIPYSVAFFVSSLLAPRLIPVLGRAVLSLGYFITVLGMSTLLTIVHLATISVSSCVLVTALLIQGFGAWNGQRKIFVRQCDRSVAPRRPPRDTLLRRCYITRILEPGAAVL